MVLNVVLESTHENEHEKQAAKVSLLHKPRPFGLSVSRNLKPRLVYGVVYGRKLARVQEFLAMGDDVHVLAMKITTNLYLLFFYDTNLP